MTREEVSARCNTIEECYEFLLAYAGQGLSGKETSAASGQVRDFLNRAVEALTGLADVFSAAVKQENLQPAERYLAFLAVLERDARDSLATDATGSRPSHDQLPADRQSERFDPSPRAAHRSVSDRRNFEAATARRETADVSTVVFLCARRNAILSYALLVATKGATGFTSARPSARCWSASR